jgi:hypothetical protein
LITPTNQPTNHRPDNGIKQKKEKKQKKHMSISRKAIAVLTRGYEDQTKYQDLIERNHSIHNNLQDKTIPILLFHEGNITPTQQIYISNQTPELNLQFIDVKSTQKAFRLEKESIPVHPETSEFPIGYRHMCSFWIIDFWHFVSEYDFLLRIDEDCVVQFEIDPVFQKMESESIQIITGHWGFDCDYVTRGLNDFTRTFLSNVLERPFDQIPTRYTSGICSISGFHLNILRKNPLLYLFLVELDFSNKIYSHRWGDGPLWGEIIGYILEANKGNPCKWERSIRYYHKSHNVQIN